MNIESLHGSQIFIVTKDNLNLVINKTVKETVDRLKVEKPILLNTLLSKNDKVSIVDFKLWSKKYGILVYSLGRQSLIYMSEFKKAIDKYRDFKNDELEQLRMLSIEKSVPHTGKVVAIEHEPIEDVVKTSSQVYVYMIYNPSSDVVKIGSSKNVLKRLKALQTSSAFELKILHVFLGWGGLEKKLHSLLSDFRLKGEWFEDKPELYEIISNEVGMRIYKDNPTFVNFKQKTKSWI